MRRYVLWCLLVGAAVAQTNASVTLLGPHNTGGRGCVACHPATVSTTASGFDDVNLSQQQLSPSYTVDDVNVSSLRLFSKSVTSFSQKIELCLSCHDGHIAPATMTSSTSFEQQLSSSTGAFQIAAASDATQSTAGDHPVGEAATLGAVGVAGFFRFSPGGCTFSGEKGDCLRLASESSTYAEFSRNYGAPSIISNGRSSPLVLPDGNPANAYVACTTCHDPHGSSRYTANADAPIAKSATNSFSTTSSVAAPYNPAAFGPDTLPSSATQFCRQCHFEENANEAAGISIGTRF